MAVNNIGCLAMSIIFFICNIIITKSNVYYGNWTTSPTKMPVAYSLIANGFYNHTIFLIGGGAYPRQLTTYNVATNSFDYFNESAISVDINGYGRYWTQ
eukprot:254746_1